MVFKVCEHKAGAADSAQGQRTDKMHDAPVGLPQAPRAEAQEYDGNHPNP